MQTSASDESERTCETKDPSSLTTEPSLQLPSAVLLRIHDLLLSPPTRSLGTFKAYVPPLFSTGADSIGGCSQLPGSKRAQDAANWRMTCRSARACAAMPATLKVRCPLASGNNDDERQAKHKAWFNSVAAFLARQPVSTEVELTVGSFEATASLAIAPWVTKVHAEVRLPSRSENEDPGKLMNAALKRLPRLRHLYVGFASCSGDSTPPRFSPVVASPGDAPALETVELNNQYHGPVLLPACIDITACSSLRSVLVVGGLHHCGSERACARVLRLAPHVLVSHQPRGRFDYCSTYSSPATPPLRFDDPALKPPVLRWGKKEEDRNLEEAFVRRIGAGLPAYCVEVESFVEGAGWIQQLYNSGFTPQTLDQVDVTQMARAVRSSTRRCMADTGHDDCLSYSESDGLGYREHGRDWDYSDEYDSEGNFMGHYHDYY